MINPRPVFGILLFLAMSGIILIPDAQLGKILWHQFQSRNYSSTTGRIMQSEVRRWKTAKGDTVTEADIQYHYEVNGQAFDGTRLRYSVGSGQMWVTQIVNEHPAGSETPVYFNPKDPVDSLLSPGLDGLDIFCVLFLMPIHMLGLAFLAAVISMRRWFKPVAGGIKIIADGNQTRIRFPHASPVFSAALAAFLASGVSIFFVACSLPFTRWIGIAATFLFLSIASGIAVYVRRWQKIRSSGDLIINEASGFIELPETCGRKERMKVYMSDIAGIAVESIEDRNRRGTVSYRYEPTLQLRNADRQILAGWPGKAQADAFSEWLGKRLGLKALGVEDQSS